MVGALSPGVLCGIHCNLSQLLIHALASFLSFRPTHYLVHSDGAHKVGSWLASNLWRFCRRRLAHFVCCTRQATSYSRAEDGSRLLPPCSWLRCLVPHIQPSGWRWQL